MRLSRFFSGLAFCLLLSLPAASPRPTANAESSIPPVWDIVADDFEIGALDAWNEVSPDDLSLVSGSGRNSPTGLAVTIGQHSSYLYKSGIARAEEGYLTFWFNPSDATIPDQDNTWMSDKSIRIASVEGAEGARAGGVAGAEANW